MSRLERVTFLDLETTGNGDPKRGAVLEVAAIEVDAEWNELRTFERVLRFDAFVPDAPEVEHVVMAMHERTGLWRECASSTFERTAVDMELEAFLGGHVVLAGNSIHFDRRWMEEHLPLSHARLSPRMIDVSGIRRAFRLWAVVEVADPPMAHRALPDCRASIALARSLMKRTTP